MRRIIALIVLVFFTGNVIAAGCPCEEKKKPRAHKKAKASQKQAWVPPKQIEEIKLVPVAKQEPQPAIVAKEEPKRELLLTINPEKAPEERYKPRLIQAESTSRVQVGETSSHWCEGSWRVPCVVLGAVAIGLIIGGGNHEKNNTTGASPSGNTGGLPSGTTGGAQ